VMTDELIAAKCRRSIVISKVCSFLHCRPLKLRSNGDILQR